MSSPTAATPFPSSAWLARSRPRPGRRCAGRTSRWRNRATATADHLAVEVEDPDLCPRFVGRYVEGVRIGPSPWHVQRRLIAAGMRPISNVVDTSNYVLLELGKPIHTFDADAVSDGRIVVRRARPGERLETLDHVDRELTPETLLISDPRGPLAIAGVMGGAASEVGEQTRNVIIESAIFDPVSIRRTAFRYGTSQRGEPALREGPGAPHGAPGSRPDRRRSCCAGPAAARPWASWTANRRQPRRPASPSAPPGSAASWARTSRSRSSAPSWSAWRSAPSRPLAGAAVPVIVGEAPVALDAQTGRRRPWSPSCRRTGGTWPSRPTSPRRSPECAATRRSAVACLTPPCRAIGRRVGERSTPSATCSRAPASSRSSRTVSSVRRTTPAWAGRRPTRTPSAPPTRSRSTTRSCAGRCCPATCASWSTTSGSATRTSTPSRSAPCTPGRGDDRLNARWSASSSPVASTR